MPVSAVDAVSPAIQRTKRLLFQPFRFSLWLRLALIGFITGEMSSSGGSFNYRLPAHNSGASSSQFLPAAFSHLPRPQLVAAIVLLALVATVLTLVFMYLGSVLRFVLFDGVLTGNVRIREGFRRWQEQGTRFFVWQLFFKLIFFSVFAVMIGIPLLLAWRAGIFRTPHEHLAVLILGGFLLFSVGALIAIVGLTIWVLTKDFVVPMMALEGVGPVEAWRRLFAMIGGQKGSYAGYIGMKVVLAIAAGILMAIAGIILILILLIPAVIAALIAYFIFTGAGIGWNVLTITLAVAAAVVFAAVFLFVLAMASVPVVTFFQSYVLQFFGSRYDRLAALVYPEPPAAPPLPA